MKIPKDLVYTWKDIDFKVGFKETIKEAENNWNRLQEFDNKAKKMGIIVGRYITHPFADGYVVYQIIQELKNRLKIVWVGGLGDDWVLPAWGYEATIDKDYALREFKSREFWNER